MPLNLYLIVHHFSQLMVKLDELYIPDLSGLVIRVHTHFGVGTIVLAKWLLHCLQSEML